MIRPGGSDSVPNARTAADVIVVVIRPPAISLLDRNEWPLCYPFGRWPSRPVYLVMEGPGLCAGSAVRDGRKIGPGNRDYPVFRFAIARQR